MIINVITNAMMYNSGDASSVIAPVSEKLYFILIISINVHPSMADTCDITDMQFWKFTTYLHGLQYIKTPWRVDIPAILFIGHFIWSYIGLFEHAQVQ